MSKYKRCLICKKKAVWSDSQERFWFCQEHSDKWSKFLVGKLPNHSGWKTIWKILMRRFLIKEGVKNEKIL